MINYLENGKTTYGQYYASGLRQLKEVINSKCRGKLRAGVILLQDNVPLHTTQVVVAEADNCGVELLPNTPYWTDLASADFFLFS